MNMERTAGLIFLGNISDEEIRSIPKDFRGDIFVIGNVICTEKCIIPGSLWLNGNLYAKDLYVGGDFFTEEGTLINTTDGGINIAGDFILKERCQIDTITINVGGDFEGEGIIDSTDIDVYGTFAFFGEINTYGSKIHAGKLEIEATTSIIDCQTIESGW